MTKTSTLDFPVFYTCTAATPDGPPFEIAWGSLALETYGVMCGSHLVRPPAAWISELARDAAALQPYGLASSDRGVRHAASRTRRRCVTTLRACLVGPAGVRHAASRNRHAHE